MRCMRKINGNEVEKFSVIKLISSEEFKEEDRERIPAGQPNAGQWVASGGSSQSGTVRDRVINRYVEEKKTRPLQTQDGTIPLAEPAFHCPTCDRTFFPSADRVAD